jgi:hypothetical protein
LSRQKSQLVVEQPERYNPSAAKQFAENSWYVPQSTSAAKADGENKPVIAAVNRCATQNQMQELEICDFLLAAGLLTARLRCCTLFLHLGAFPWKPSNSLFIKTLTVNPYP